MFLTSSIALLGQIDSFPFDTADPQRIFGMKPAGDDKACPEWEIVVPLGGPELGQARLVSALADNSRPGKSPFEYLSPLKGRVLDFYQMQQSTQACIHMPCFKVRL